MQGQHAGDALAQLGGRPPACEGITQGAVQRKVEHALHQRPAALVAHVAFDLAAGLVVARAVDAEAFAEDQKLPPPGALRHPRNARRAGVAGVQEIGEELGRHVERGVYSVGIDTGFAYPVAVALAQGAAHGGVLGVQVIQASHLES